MSELVEKLMTESVDPIYVDRDEDYNPLKDNEKK